MASGEIDLRGLSTEIEALRDSERFRHTLLESAPEFVVQASLDHVILYINRVAPGYALHDVIGTSIFDYVAPECRDAAREAIANAAATGEMQQYASRASAGADGQMASYLTRVGPIRADDGAVGSVLLICSDVTKSERSLDQLRQSQARLGVALDASKLGIWSYDVASSAGAWDDRAREMLGGDADPPIESPSDFIERRVHIDDREMVNAELRKASERGTYGPLEHRVTWPDGTQRWISAACHAVRDERGEVTQLIGCVQDITDRRALEARLLEAQKLEGIGRLAGGIAHDFNNMLMTIISNAELALMSPGVDDLTREHLDEIKLAGERSAALTRQLLAFARRQVIAPQVVNVGDVITRVHALLARLLGEHITLSVNVRDRSKLRIDPSQLEQVLLNLVTNARDAMDDGGHLDIETRNVELDEAFCRGRLDPGSHVAIIVRDTGVGIAPAAIGHIFEPFFSTRATLGTGLGLATCYGIAQQNGGSIEVDSVLGRGTTFTVYLPRISTADDVPVAAAVRRIDRGGGETLLVVEDEQLVRRVVVRALRAAGYEVLAAANADDALALSASHPGEIPLVVSDVVMPGLSGPKLVAKLQATRPALRVLYTSGYVRHELSAEQAAAPGVAFLQKPFRPDQLLAVVRELIADLEARDLVVHDLDAHDLDA